MTQTECAVVLGSGLHSDGSATEVTRLRALAAAEFVLHRPMKLILSGSRSLTDPGTHGKTEASAMQEIVIAQGVSSDTLLLEDESLDTLGNAIFSARRFLCKENPGTLFVITSPFHMERSLFIFRHVLGAKWTVLAHEAPEWSGETRQTHAATAMARAREFFENIEPGDVEACLAKLVQSNQAYRDKVA